MGLRVLAAAYMYRNYERFN